MSSDDSEFDEFVSEISDNFTGATYLVKNPADFNTCVITGTLNPQILNTFERFIVLADENDFYSCRYLPEGKGTFFVISKENMKKAVKRKLIKRVWTKTNSTTP